jgi:hypothetical protein
MRTEFGETAAPGPQYRARVIAASIAAAGKRVAGHGRRRANSG